MAEIKMTNVKDLIKFSSSPTDAVSNTIHDTERKVEKINNKVRDMSIEIKMIKKNNRKRNWVKGNKITYKKGRIRQ